MKTCTPDPKPPKRKKQNKKNLRPGDKTKILLRDNHACKNPSCLGESPTWLDIHHIKNRSRGGKNNSENLILLCRSCHDRIHHRGTLKCSGEYPDVIFIDI